MSKLKNVLEMLNIDPMMLHNEELDYIIEHGSQEDAEYAKFVKNNR